jgi:hypothetical protein
VGQLGVSEGKCRELSKRRALTRRRGHNRYGYSLKVGCVTVFVEFLEYHASGSQPLTSKRY